MHINIGGSIFAYICKYAKYAKYRWGSIYMHIMIYPFSSLWYYIFAYMCKYSYILYRRGIPIFEKSRPPPKPPWYLFLPLLPTPFFFSPFISPPAGFFANFTINFLHFPPGKSSSSVFCQYSLPCDVVVPHIFHETSPRPPLFFFFSPFI